MQMMLILINPMMLHTEMVLERRFSINSRLQINIEVGIVSFTSNKRLYK